MWSDFFYMYIVEAIFLLLPGFLFAKSLISNWLYAVCAAPAITIVFYSSLAIVLQWLNIGASWALLVIPSVIIGAVALGIRFLLLFLKGRRPKFQFNFKDFCINQIKQPINIFNMALYIICGVLTTGFIFVKSLDGPESLVKKWDSLTHLTGLRAMLNSGKWSSFGSVSAYADATYASEGTGFYPGGWHSVTLAAADATGVSSYAAYNASVSLFISLVLPLSMLFMMGVVFKKRIPVIWFGAFFVGACAVYPYRMLLVPLVANTASLAVFGATMALGFLMLEISTSKADRIGYIILAFISLGSQVFLQPNTVCLALVFVLSYGIYYLVKKFPFYRFANGGRNKIISIALLIVGFIGAWLFMFNSSLFEGVINYERSPVETVSEAFGKLLDLSFYDLNAQGVFAVLVIIGAVYCLYTLRFWFFVVNYVITSIMFFCSAALEKSLFRDLFAGFWYTAWGRLAANIAVTAIIPLGAIGLYVIWLALKKIYNPETIKATFIWGASLGCVLSALFCWSNYSYQSLFVYNDNLRDQDLTGIGYITYVFTYENDWQSLKVYDAGERAFVQKALEITGGDLVLNIAHDGSAYALNDGMNVFCRFYGTLSCNTLETIYDKQYGDIDLGDALLANSEEVELLSDLIYKNLFDISSNTEVKEAVQTLGAKYVLQLDYGYYDYSGGENEKTRLHSYYCPTGYDGSWDYYPEYGCEHHIRGLSRIDENTPGFELVLDDGENRLYKILDVD